MQNSKPPSSRLPAGNFLLRALGIAAAAGLAVGLYVGIAHLL